MLPQTCPLCNTSAINLKVVTNHVSGAQPSDDHAFFSCNKCSVTFQFPYYSEEELEKFYIDEFDSFMYRRSGKDSGWDLSEAHINANKLTYLRRYGYLSNHLFENIKILEVGCSSGFMLVPFSQNGYQCTGVEPSHKFRAYLNNNGIRTYPSLEALSAATVSKFNLVCHFFVLEHIRDPKKFLLQQIALCEKDGKIIFEIPSSSDALVQIYDIPQFERFYWSKPHPWYFNQQSLDYLLRSLNCKYTIVPHQRYDLSNHISWALTGKPGGQSRYSSMFGSDIENLYKAELVKHGFFDTLIAIIEV
jgi:2-polyprenyl-3-methyl-5-hydroxy-6-metoxy-1,4-benzoquinol methylase